MKYFFFLLSLLLPLYGLGLESEVLSQQCIGSQAVRDSYSNIHLYVDDIFQKELSEHIHCKISSASHYKDFVTFKKGQKNIFFWAYNDLEKINNYHGRDFFSHKSIHTYLTAIPIILQKESFLI